MAANVPRKPHKFTAGIEVTNGLAVDTLQASNGVQSDVIDKVPTATGVEAAALIPANASVVRVTSAGANNIMTLPAGVAALVGMEVTLLIVGGTNAELRTPATSGATINNVDSDGTAEALLVSGNTYKCQLVAVDTWILRGFTVAGADVAAIIPD